jgi:hypothetical protein
MPSHSKAINRGIMKASSISSLLYIVDQRLGDFSAVNAITTLHRIASLSHGSVAELALDQEQEACLSELLEMLQQEVKDFSAWDLSNTMWALAVLKWQCPELMRELCAVSSAKAKDFNAQDLSGTMCAAQLANES